MTATIIKGHFIKPVELPQPLAEQLTRDQVAAVRELAKQWNVTVAGAVLMIVSAYLEAKERA